MEIATVIIALAGVGMMICAAYRAGMEKGHSNGYTRGYRDGLMEE